MEQAINEFNSWNTQKQRIHNRKSVFCNTREIWWCSLGKNIGSEQNGKNEIFERPVLVIGIFNKDICRIIPLTSSQNNDKHHQIITYHGMTGSLVLSQMKTVSTKRFSRKMCRLDKSQFNNVLSRLKESL